MAVKNIKKDTSLRKAILQAAITGQLISTVVEPVETTGGESDVLFSNEKKSKTKLDSEADLPLARTSLLTTPSPRGSAPKTPAETGKQLLDRIIEERNKKLLAEWEEVLKKNVGGKATLPSFASKTRAKKPTLIVASKIDEDEIPFEIPENWCWCRLGDVGDWGAGATPNRSKKEYYSNEGIPWIKTGELNNGLVTSSEEFITEKALKECSLRYNKVGDVMIAMYGATIGKVAIAGIELTTNQACCACTPANGLYNKFLFYFLMANKENFIKQGEGGAQPNISREKIVKTLLPLPPLSVQNAIVAKLEQVLPLVDAYENAVLQKEELKSTLSDKVKKAILQEAITGKLTEQWRKQKALVEPAETTETGKQLLARIIKERNAKALADWEEKAKKPVPVVASEIGEEDVPFEIPESWCWCKLGDLVPFGQCENAEPNEIEDEAWILDLEDIEKDSGKILQFKTKKEVDSKSTKHIFKKGYVLYSKLRPYLNKCVIAPKDGYCTSEILPLDFGNLINNKFAQIFLMSPYFVDYTDSLSFGVKMPRLGTEDGKKALVPLPSLEEQEEIVKKVEELKFIYQEYN